MDYLLDTNACIAIINGSPLQVRTRLEQVLAASASIFVSSITGFELWYGVFKSARKDFNQRRVELFFAGPVTTLPFEERDAEASGRLRAMLESSGKPIGAYDLLLAGQAMERNLTLVTANISEFSRIKGLHWQNWARS